MPEMMYFTLHFSLHSLLLCALAIFFGKAYAKTVRPKPIRPLHHSSRLRNPLSIEQGYGPSVLVLGSDESGTGALAGPLVTATVTCLQPHKLPDALLRATVRDSKALTTPEQRQEVYNELMQHPLYHCTVAIREPNEIDQASSLQDAVNQAFRESISTMVHYLEDAKNGDGHGEVEFYSIVDGKSPIPNLPVKSRPWIRGDTIVYTVALASVVARVTRDRLVQETAAATYPEYGFEQHGGYPNPVHFHALHTYGTTPYHRRSCKLVRQRDTINAACGNHSSPHTTTAATSRSEFIQGLVLAATASFAFNNPRPAEAMYTDKQKGIRFPEIGEISAAIPSEWDEDDLQQVITDKSRFQRLDSSNDSIFYQDPRFVEHIDDGAVHLLTEYLNRVVVQDPNVHLVLDLCSSWTSHLPEHGLNDKLTRVAGLGMNAKELAANPSLTEWVVTDLNERPVLPYEDQSFDSVLCQLSIDYLTQPIQVCREISRVLKPSGKVHVIFSNRLFLQKAVAAWTGADDIDHAYTVGEYLKVSGSLENIVAEDLSFRKSGKIVGDPLYVVTAVRTP